MKIKKEVIVTGGSGFLGKNLIQSISKKYKIISVDRKIKVIVETLLILKQI